MDKFRCHTNQLNLRGFPRVQSSGPEDTPRFQTRSHAPSLPGALSPRLARSGPHHTSLLGTTLTVCSTNHALFIRSIISFSSYICSPSYSFLFYFSLLASRVRVTISGSRPSRLLASRVSILLYIPIAAAIIDRPFPFLAFMCFRLNLLMPFTTSPRAFSNSRKRGPYSQ